MRLRLLALWLSLIPTTLFAQTPANEPAMKPSALHHAITQQSGWLNTSRALTAEELKGRIILLDFWTFCCINCMHVIPDLQYLEKTFGDKLTVIGVHSAKFLNERDSENIRNAILRYDIEHPVTNDHNFAIWQSFGIKAWPTFVLINPDGLIEEIYSGEGNRDAVEEDIRALLKKYEGRINSAPLPMALEKGKVSPQPLDFPAKLDYLPDYKGAPALVVSDSGHHRILLLDPQGKVLAQFGSGVIGLKDGDAKTAQFHSPQGVLAGKHEGKPVLYVADTENHALRRIWVETGMVETIAGTGQQGYERRVIEAPALRTRLASPWDIAFYPDESRLAIAMAGTHQIWSYDIGKKTVSVIAGNGRESIDDGEYPYNSLSQPSGLATVGGKLYIIDSETSALRVLERGELTTLIGTGLFDFGYKEGVLGEALMQHPIGLYADQSGVYIADSYNHSIRRYDPNTKTLHDYTGFGSRGAADGQLKTSSFNEPNDVLRVGDKLYVTDTNNHRLRVIDMTQRVATTLPVGKQSDETLEPATTNTQELPNLADIPPLTVSMTAGILNLQLAEGWKINAEAPSELAVVFGEGNNITAVKSYGLQELKGKRMPLPTMDVGKPYRLRGTLYYCLENNSGQCLIKSFDVPLVPSDEATTEITLPVN